MSACHEWERIEGNVWYPAQWECRRCRTVVSSRRDDGMPPEEIAGKVGINPDCEAQMVKNIMSE